MYTRSENCSLDLNQTISFPTAGRFALPDRQMVQIYIDKYAPMSCEYNFANLFSWQEAYQYTWRLYKGRLVIYDGVNQCAFMPLGEPLPPEELAGLCRELLLTGLESGIGLVTDRYLDQYPESDHYFSVTPERDYAEYIYAVDSLCQLNSEKLHKKKNLISQFERLYPAYEIQVLSKKNQDAARAFSRDLLYGQGGLSQTLEAEFMAMEKAFDNFEDLGLEGLALMVDNQMAAFSIFSQLNPSTYNVQFEKSDFDFKGAAQVINQQTALFLRDKCEYINREQDLGIRGLRQAKMSYEPEKLLVPHTLRLRRS
ncbi:MAG TPA: phosphatidylglycerol lysyltransferase domain-containing protein [Desulfotignum sp.]|nr:phosphatidylglycerol lysyltransferase domain-containing protein [Desulfotignum sp.]